MAMLMNRLLAVLGINLSETKALSLGQAVENLNPRLLEDVYWDISMTVKVIAAALYPLMCYYVYANSECTKNQRQFEQ